MTTEHNNEMRKVKGVTPGGVPFAVTVEYGAPPDTEPVRILGRYESAEGDLVFFYVDPHPEGYFACYTERPFADPAKRGSVLESVADSAWMCVPEAIRDYARETL